MQTEDHDSKAKETNALDNKAILDLGLSPDRIRLHAKRIQKALEGSIKTTLPILGACTTNNGAVISWKRMLRFTEADPAGVGRSFLDSAQKYWNARYLVTCVPAAGAASRYLASLRRFVSLTESNLESLHQLADPAFEWTDATKRLPGLPESVRRTGRARLAAQEVPTDLKLLAMNFRTSFPSLAGRTALLASEWERHLTAKHSVSALSPKDRKKLLHSSKEEAHGPTPETSPISSEAIIRRHWSLTRKPMAWEGASNGLRIIRSPAEIRSAGEELLARSEHLRFDSARRHESELSSQRTHLSEITGASATGRFETEDSDTGEFLPSRASESIRVYSACRILLDEFESCPKAFVPTTAQEDDFLFLKLVEQMSLMPCQGNVIVCPADMTKDFQKHILAQGERLKSEARNIFELRRTPFTPAWLDGTDQSKGLDTAQTRGPWVVLEQGNNLSTIRFTADGRPWTAPDGSYSRVSAGHGELVHIFSDILSRFPEAECLHIRNIDNIIGTAPERRREIQTPSRLFRIVRDCLEAIRVYLDTVDALSRDHAESALSQTELDDVVTAAGGALENLSWLTDFASDLRASDWQGSAWRLSLKDPAAHARREKQVDSAANILSTLFHWTWQADTQDFKEKIRLLKENLRRPLSVFGVVRKETDDVGGGPVFSQLPSGETIKLCMEMPHASDEDKQIYFGSRGRATHFNPVLVFFELQTHKFHPSQGSNSRVRGRPVDFQSLYDNRFWIMASKEHQGQKVCYHETVLYELIGNSATANVLFVEVPRTLFNPHKAITDGLGQDRRSHGFNETLKAQDERNLPGTGSSFS